MKPAILLLLLSLTLAGCATAAPTREPAPPVATTTTEQATPEGVSPSPEAATQTAPNEAAAEATPAAQSSPVAYGRNDDGTFFHGAPDAPVTLIDYSDFL